MSYITTFDTTFFALCVMYAIWVGVSAIASHQLRKAYTQFGNMANLIWLRRFNLTVNGLWFTCFAIAAYFSLRGLTTFFAVCAVFAVVMGTYNYLTYQRRLQRELMTGLNNHMVDTLPTPNIR